jgi:photosynthetic reaction center H subunit
MTGGSIPSGVIGGIIGGIDVAQAVLVVFVGFVLGLFVWLRREDKREGYPLEDPAGGKPLVGVPLPPPPKPFMLMNGELAYMPHPEGRTDLALSPSRPVPGAPFVPTGDPLADGVGPAAWASKRDEPLMTWEGAHQVRPLRLRPGWGVERGDPDPRGMPVIDREGVRVGVVRDLWLDNGVQILRYIEIDVTAEGAPPGTRAMVPIYFAEVEGRLGEVSVPALTAAQFAAFPQLREPDVITALEEDRASAWCAGGLHYNSRRWHEGVL